MIWVRELRHGVSTGNMVGYHSIEAAELAIECKRRARDTMSTYVTFKNNGYDWQIAPQTDRLGELIMFDDTFPMDESEWEYTTRIEGMQVRVTAVGGGTVGRTYTQNYWHYQVSNEDGIVAEGSDLFIPFAGHISAALIALELLDEEN